jgi:hypothetical protein
MPFARAGLTNAPSPALRYATFKITNDSFQCKDKRVGLFSTLTDFLCIRSRALHLNVSNSL